MQDDYYDDGYIAAEEKYELELQKLYMENKRLREVLLDLQGISYSPEWKNTPISNYYEMIHKALNTTDGDNNVEEIKRAE